MHFIFTLGKTKLEYSKQQQYLNIQKQCGTNNPDNIYLLQVNNRNTSKMCEISLKLAIKTPERRH